MTRINLVAIACLAVAFFGQQPVRAYQAPWCAVIQLGPGSNYWDCQYRVVRRVLPQEAIFWQAIVASAIRVHTMSPALQDTRAQRNAALPRSSSSTGHVVNVRFYGP